METMANLFQSDKAFGGKAQIKRRIANDMQGYIAEMLAKAVNQNALNAELDAADRDNLLCLLKISATSARTTCAVSVARTGATNAIRVATLA